MNLRPASWIGISKLKNAYDSYNLSPRSYFRLIKIARTMADLDESPEITHHHVSEAIQFRPKSESYV